ncbi:TonB-dependent receptor [Pontibacter sp. Tf4]|uniref:TonB-dependent receptor n=1 Tax=Pontibacter sp. Tf4 TaxID=2761620 RepID=UPI001623D388|nr:TonB-dependent receptor [Pontibacter sp. Tf4]MBB6612885.1 TonB-dependent receptor [Pontibacter sp. Tf4]
MKKCLLFLITLVISFTTVVSAFAQGTVKGKIVDGTTKDPLPGATVILKGTSLAVPAGADGTFTMKVDDPNATAILINFVGFAQKEVSIAGLNGTKNLGTITLQPSEASLGEILVTANSYAIERETPVAMSTITSEIIVEKAGQQEFPELLKSTPGVYATKAGGGYGDSRINLRGFQSANIAVMINGVPVNDMENGKVYWSNWAGLTDVTKAMQVQRGLGASKVAVPSVGGTINIITRTTDAVKGGSIYQGIGSEGYSKTAFSYSTGLTENGWAFAVSGSKTEGDGWAEGLQYEAYNYFFNVSKMINDKHTLSLTGFGAPQYHAQRYDRLTIQEYRDAPQGLRYNPNWGVLNGEAKTISGNFYHKPQFSLNHYWTIDDKSFLSTAAYASVGTGGNEFDGGTENFDNHRFGGNKYQPLNLDAIVEINGNSEDGRALGYLQSNRNDHKWYGVLSTYQRSMSENFDLLAGVDLRYYKGIHFNSVRNLLGAQYVLDNSNVNAPNNKAGQGDKIGYYNEGIVLWEGGFLQGEYKAGPLAAFISLAGSNTSYQRIDYFKYADNDPMQKSPKVNFFGFQTKGGANYNLTENHNVFANIGYFEKAPFFNSVFLRNENIPNEEAVREKILSYELGYGYVSEKLSGNVNLYRTTWKDRSFTKSVPGQDNERYFVNLLGVDALHQGIEIDFNYRPIKTVSLKGMISIGDWTWMNDLGETIVYDENQKQVDKVSAVYMSDKKVGDSPQTTAALGLDVNVTSELKIGVDYNYYANFNADFNPTDLTTPGISTWEVPNYSVFDANASFKFKFAGLNGTLYATVNNLFNTEYISDAFARFGTRKVGEETVKYSDVTNTQVYFGNGTTWTTGLKINF